MASWDFAKADRSLVSLDGDLYALRLLPLQDFTLPSIPFGKTKGQTPQLLCKTIHLNRIIILLCRL